MRIKNTIIIVAGSGLLTIFQIFALTPILKNTIESVGTSIVGAKVDVGSVSANMFALRFNAQKIEITDTANTMRNAVEFGTVAVKLNLAALLENKYIIEEFRVENVRFGTPRTYDGAVARRERPQQQAASDETSDANEAGKSPFDFVPGDVPSPEEIDTAVRANLTVIAEGEALQTNIVETADKWRTTFESHNYDERAEKLLNDAKSFNTSISTTDLNAARRDVEQRVSSLNAMKSEAESLYREIEETRDEFERDFDSLEEGVRNVRNAGANDVDNALNSLDIKNISVANVADIIFGDSVGNRVRQGMRWFTRIRSGYNRLDAMGLTPKKAKRKKFGTRGYEVSFPQENAYPKFLLRNAVISASPEVTDDSEYALITGTVRNIVSDQDILGAPTTANLAVSFPKYGRMTGDINAIFDRRDNASVDTYEIEVRNIPITDMQFSGGGGLPHGLNRATLTIEPSSVEVSSNGVRAELYLELSGVDLAYEEGETLSRGAEIVKDVLTGIDRINLDVTYFNPVEGEPQIELQSDLDQLLARRINEVLGEQVVAIRREVESRIRARVDEEVAKVTAQLEAEKRRALAPYEEQIAEVEAARAEIEEKLGIVDGNYTDLEGTLNAERERLQQEARDAARAEQERLKREAEQKAAEEKERLRKEAEEKAREELRRLF